MRNDLRNKLKDIFFAAIDAVNPYNIMIKQGNLLKSDSLVTSNPKIYAISFGKAAYAMSKALEDTLGTSITKGIVITTSRLLGYDPLKHFNLYTANHPVPDERGLLATQKVIELLRDTDEETLVIFLISGGGSALLVAPYGAVDLQAKQTTTEMLLKAGANIKEINTVRKHISAVKGGRLAELAYPARVISLILSDVPGDDIDIIASGPTAPDPSTYSEALSVIRNTSIIKDPPVKVIKTLMSGQKGILPETPKLHDRTFERVRNIIIGNNAMAIEAARENAYSSGCIPIEITMPVNGEARKAALEIAKTALEIQHNVKKTGNKPVCLITGGETTVTVTGSGKGGRNTEFALAFALEIDGIQGISLLSAGTDGVDGPTEAAGAFADGSTVRLAREKGLNPQSFLEDNDSHTFFSKLNDLFITGPTGTNVMDLQMTIIE